MSSADEARICRMSDLEAAVSGLKLEIQVVGAHSLADAHKQLEQLAERLTLLEAAIGQAVPGTVELTEPEDALARLHQQFRAKCRKAEGHER